MSICIIPARGGSKRIPRKNTREFCGKPMIAWSIETASKSACFDRIVVSTEDAEIAEIAKAHGAEAPFVRPINLADSITATVPVIAHAVKALNLSPQIPVCCLYATAPFAASADLRKTRDLLLENKDAFVLPVTTFAYPIQRALRRDSSGHVHMFDRGNVEKRSQDLEQAWHDVGQFYWALAGSWRSSQNVFANETIGFPIPRYRSQDIDTLEDWIMAERLFSISA